jgi:hypothetical protein
MKRIIVAMIAVCAVAFTATPIAAQQTTGNIQGRIIDAQKAAVPGVTVTAKSASTGFSRSEVTDSEGIYRLNGLPVGSYDLHADLSGFAPYERKGVVVNVSQTVDLNIDLNVAGVSESVKVTAESPLIQTSSSSVGGVVDIGRIESLPLNGPVRQPGGDHPASASASTATRPRARSIRRRLPAATAQPELPDRRRRQQRRYGRRPAPALPARGDPGVQPRHPALQGRYGRSNGGVMNIVTKSGTNKWQGSFFELFRDTNMNAETETENQADDAARLAGEPEPGKQEYRRNQFGGSFGGPIMKDKAHFFGAVERTQQNTFQSVDLKGLFPGSSVYPTPYTETC